MHGLAYDLQAHLPEVPFQPDAVLPDRRQLLQLLGTGRIRRNPLLEVICHKRDLKAMRAKSPTYADPDRVEEFLRTVRLNPPPVRVSFQLDLALIYPSLQPQSHFAIADETARYCHVQVNYVTLIAHVEDVTGISGAWSCFRLGNECS